MISALTPATETSSSLQILIVAVIAFSVLVPVALALVWKKRTGVGLLPFVVGCAVFPMFTVGLENIAHYFFTVVDSPISRVINGSTILYALYASLAAGIFEETGRWFAFRTFLAKEDEPSTAVAYGIGHGGMEVFLVLGYAYIIYYTVAFGGGLGNPEADASIMSALSGITVPGVLMAMLERLVAMTLHCGLSVIVFKAARDSKKLYFLAVLLHALANFPVFFYRVGSLSIVFVECFAAVIAGIAAVIATKLYRNEVNNV